MAADDLLKILASQKSGTMKSEFFGACKAFGIYITEYQWQNLYYLKKKNVSMGLYNQNLRWYCYEAEYYRALVKFVHENPAGKTDMGMAMGRVPEWIDKNHDLFVKTFKLEYFV